MTAVGPGRGVTVLVANPSSDIYGSDLQMLESITAMVERGWKVVVATPDDGPLVALIEERGAEVLRVDCAVVRREYASPSGLWRLVRESFSSLRNLLRVLRTLRPTLVYANTITIPWWFVAARLCRIPVVCHVHEAEAEDPLPVRLVLYGPLLLAHRLIVISRPSMETVCATVPRLRRRATMIFNGVREPTEPPRPAVAGPGPRRLVVLGRLSPRKGTDVALEAVALLRRSGRDVTLDVCGSTFPGYEWFEEQLRRRAAESDLDGAVDFSGYISPIWPALERAEVSVAPSLREPFGNAVVEAQLAQRPVVAAAAMGHLETVIDGETGLLVTPGDAQATADAIARLLDDGELAARIAETARRTAEERFSLTRYRREVADLLAAVMKLPAGGSEGRSA